MTTSGDAAGDWVPMNLTEAGANFTARAGATEEGNKTENKQQSTKQECNKRSGSPGNDNGMP